jgi:hypothetical protein
MRDDLSLDRLPLSEPIDTILGQVLSPQAGRFVAEHADFLRRVDFKDIAEHPTPEIRFMEGHYSSDGVRHAVWLDRESSDFEGLLLHQTMRAILMERGFPRAECLPAAVSCRFLRYLGVLLSSVVIDPIIDGQLAGGGFPVYNRQMLIRRATADVWRDAVQEAAVPEFLFRKWALFTVVLRIDTTFKGDGAEQLRKLIRDEFPLAAEFGDRFSTTIIETGFTDLYSALMVMIRLRNTLKLHDKILIVDGRGTYW